MENNNVKKCKKISCAAILSFLFSLALCSSITIVTIINRENYEELKIEHLILDKTLHINEIISRMLYRTNSLATMVIQGNGVINDFERMASSIADDPVILNVLIAPDCIVSNVYPLSGGNENFIGFDFFSDMEGNKEAVLAIDTGELVLGGPFRSVQGIDILAGRLPVYIDTPDEKNVFWGLVSVSLKFPQILDNAELDILNYQDFSYELWRINPDTNEKQVIKSNFNPRESKAGYIEKHVPVINADWYLKVWLTRKWYNYTENIILLSASLLISLLILFIMLNNFKLKQMRNVLEDMAKCDPLTGIYNRRHFMEMTQMSIMKERRLDGDCFIVIFDLDKFKVVNDTYGHKMGDNVLIETTVRIKSNIRPYDVFARYGGEEFILYASRTDRKGIEEMIERLRICICNKKFECDNVSISISASFGIAIIEDENIDKAIIHADEAMYTAKNNGRNRFAVYTEQQAVQN